jgi:1-acyl-sn-glycerol-3-phosphate acyltransferase
VFYAFIRGLASLALRLFYRLRVNAPAAEPEGPIIFVGNHPNGLIDPALVFVITRRQVTFLAKEPLFRMPVIGWILKGLHALPVYRKQDNPGQMTKNEGTLEAARTALVQGRAITIFPEGKSHSEPMLAELKTGAARIALGAVREGAPVRIIPVGFTYAEKHLFRSSVLIEVGPAIEVTPFLPPPGAPEAAEKEAARQLTERIAEGLKAVTVNLKEWEDLPLIQTAEQLYAFRQGEKADRERLKRWAKGLQLFRDEQPERFEQVRSSLMSFRHRLELVHANPKDLTLVYKPGQVATFVVKNLLALCLGLPLFVLGVVLFGLPYQVPRLAARNSELDTQATVKFLGALLMSLLWWPGLTVAAWMWGGWIWGVVALVGVPPLALFTLYFLERWAGLKRDIAVFFTLGSRAGLKALLLQDGERLSAEVEKLAGEYRPRVEQGASS